MPRWVLVLVVILVVLLGGLFVLAGMDTEKQPTQIEKVVPLDNLAS